MASEKFNLSWNDFENCTRNSFRELINEQDFADVTLVSNDDKQVKAHKVILSSCSPVFKNLLLTNPHPHPLIFLSEMSHKNLEAFIQFMYTGQVEIEQDCLEDFLTMAGKLKIKGLCQDQETIKMTEISSKQDNIELDFDVTNYKEEEENNSVFSAGDFEQEQEKDLMHQKIILCFVINVVFLV